MHQVTPSISDSRLNPTSSATGSEEIANNTDSVTTPVSVKEGGGRRDEFDSVYSGTSLNGPSEMRTTSVEWTAR